jgi:hypothetical protein
MRSARLTPLLALLTVAVLLGIVAVASSAPKPSPNVGITITAQKNPIVFGSSTRIAGKVTGTSKSNVSVRLEQKPHPFTGDWQGVSTTTTVATGDYSFASVGPRVNTLYRVVGAGSLKAVSKELRLNVRIKVALRLSDSTPSRGERVRFSGPAAPEHDGSEVLIQRRTFTGRWRTVKRTTLKDAGTELSRFSTRIRVRRDGTYRARIPHDADHADGLSRSKRANVPG